MLSRLYPVWIVASREVRDQMRDWRVISPLLILTIGFPFVMNEVARQTVNFINQYGAELVIDSLVPFSILIIGFFPNTVSLVMALESFVGEKERGTIEPLLSSPLEDWQMYLGKLIVGSLTPLIASYTAVLIYVLMVSRLDIKLPGRDAIFQLLLLTTAHAIVMVSGAILVSVQSTSVKAANLLASFIIIPVAFLLQGESVLLFWGNGNLLWLAVIGVMILAALLIRLGLAHFQREYLLGREVDVLNLGWAVKFYLTAFKGGATSIAGWYRLSVFGAMRRLALPALFMVLIAGVGAWLGYDQVRQRTDLVLANTSNTEIAALANRAENPSTISQMGVELSVPALFGHNVRAVLIIFFAGLVSFGVLGVLFYLVNIGLVGGVLTFFGILGVSPATLFMAGILPHGMFELPALLLGSAAVLRFGVALVTPQAGRSIGEVVIDLLADWTKIFIGLILPLLAIAAVVETYITPAILAAALK